MKVHKTYLIKSCVLIKCDNKHTKENVIAQMMLFQKICSGVSLKLLKNNISKIVMEAWLFLWEKIFKMQVT